MPVKEFYLLSVGHIFTESKKYSELHHAGIVLKGVDFRRPNMMMVQKEVSSSTKFSELARKFNFY